MDRLSGVISNAEDHGVSSHVDDDSDTETVEVPGDDDGTEPPEETQPHNSVNLVSLFNETEQRKIAMRVNEDFEEDIKNRSEHMRRLRRWYELYAGIQKIKNWPFVNAANVNVPLLTYAVLQVHGRLFDMLLPSHGDLFNSIPTRSNDPEEIDRAERTELFANWYYRERVADYRMSYDATFWQLLIFGSAFRYSYWDTTENRLCVEWISAENMVVPYHCKVTDPSMRGVPRYTLVRWKTLFEIQEKGEGDDPEYENTDKIGPSSVGSDNKSDSELKQAVDEIDGVSAPRERRFLEDEDRRLLEQHRWLRLPNDNRHPSFDGKPHPVVVTMDKATQTVLRIVLREEEDPADAGRFQQQQAQYMASQQMQLPAEEPQPQRKREMTFFTHYSCFQGEGFYGLGLGHFLGPLNEAMNTLFNQQIDRSTVNNAGGGIISRQVRFQRGSIDRQPGLYVEVDAPANVMKDALQNWPQVAPDPDGRWFVTYIEQMANRVSGAGDTLSGEPIGANETARAAMARYEQAQKQITVLANRIIGYMTCDVRRDWRLFSVYLDEQEYHNVIDGSGKPRQVQIGRQDFIADAKVVPAADPRIASHAQRVDEAQQFVQQVTNPQMAPPELAQNPMVRYVAIKNMLLAMDQHEVSDMLQPPQPPQPPPPIPQWQENAGFLKDQDQQVNPADDDDAHLQEMQSFRADPLGYEQMSPTGKKMFDNHQRAHLAAKHVKTRTAIEQAKQAGNGVPPTAGNGAGGMA